MSLIVSIIAKRDVEVDTEDLEARVPEPHNNLFGFESYRYSFWGNNAVKELGCELIYSLKETNVYVFDEEIEKLQREFHIILGNLDFLILRTTFDKEFIEFAAGNALEMIKIALREKDKVGIALW
ncbi:hypothetical protein [Paenibacillus typhae]|uniref:Uncharacterized protein n=1 Tax=Paenibacillus typhae TaxID=1174501 RepID=A0A1G8FHQ1_9BACL|nr:hypothetical protein [Paenibacillus typhae]SDH81612.1 hypothetical protein SAMN05216192_101244 [Paenibacillus typhae]